MATWKDRFAHPLRTLANARWKTANAVHAFLLECDRRRNLALDAYRYQFGERPSWVIARNKRRQVVDYGPACIFLEPTNICNLHCPMCLTGLGLAKRKPGLMSLDLVSKIVAEIHHTPEQFGFWLAGEPMLHPRIVEMVSIAAKAGLKPSLHSNATRITRELSEGLIKAGLDWISFSFDGDNQTDYERLRPPATYAETVAKIRLFLKVREELGGSTPRVVVQTLIPFQSEAVHPHGIQLQASEAFRRQFEDCGVDEFIALLAHSWAGQLEGYKGVSPNVRDTGHRWVCNVPFRDMTIAWNGDVVTCCGDLDGLNILGNVAEDNLYEIWNGEGYQRFRKAMVTRGIQQWPLCGHCERIWTVVPHPQDYHLRFEILRYRLRL